jgi:Mrp family chromosome partitioning ATPase
MNQTDSFGIIRATVEAEIAAPGVLTISSVRVGDGKTGVAVGIARSLATAGYRTLLIDAGSDEGATLSAKLGVLSPPPVPVAAAAQHLSEVVRPAFEGCDILSLRGGDDAGASALAVADLYATVRTSYQYAIVDARTVSAGGATFARCADGVVLAVREGRAADAGDGEAVALLERVRARFLGVVATVGAPSAPTVPPDGAGVRQPIRAVGDAIGSAVAQLRDLFVFRPTTKDRGTAVGPTTPE